MSDLYDKVLREKYRQYFVNDPLAFARESTDWTAFPPLLNDLYHNDTENGGNAKISVKTMIKVLFLQSMFNIVGEKAEILIKYRISFLNFLDYPNQYPDARTIWLLKERIFKTGRDRIIWNEL
ncbi:transposase [Cuniculiplasma sp. SKW4]|uniref:transposase n=1 Tax=Cuniculiplasma sp. SKW4 TaxID=3400171 RepID=UPI003FD14B32